MIEVEKKCVITSRFFDFLNNNAQKLDKKTFSDTFFDFDDYRLIKNDIWLRKRNENYELKLPLNNRDLDVYEEIEDEKQILENLHLQNFDSLIELGTIVTCRQKFQIDGFHIDVDEVTSPGTDFFHNQMEIELMIEDSYNYETAKNRILEFMREHALQDEVVNGKFVEYAKVCKPEIYELLKKNPRFANRIVV